MSGSELATIFGAFGVILVGFFKYAESREKEFEKSRQIQTDAFNKALEKLGNNIDRNTESNKEIATYTRQGNEEAKERNGHLGEQNVQIIKLITDHNKEVETISGNVLKAVSNVKTQNVATMNIKEAKVSTEVVENEIVEHKE